MNTLKQFKTQIIVGTSVLLTCFLVWFGYGASVNTITKCEAVSTTRTIAEFSEYSCGMDFEGNTSCDTDYWDEPASEVWTVRLINGQIHNPNDRPYKIINSELPHVSFAPVWQEMKGETDFDNFSQRRKSKYYIYFDDGDYVEDPFSVHSYCMVNINNEIPIKTWYGIKYSSQLL